MKVLLITSILAAIMLFMGCGDPMTEGIAIGVGVGSEAATSLAKEDKNVLIAQILQLKADLANSASPEETAAIQAKLDEVNKKQEIAELTQTITEQIQAGIKRDWGDKPLEGEAGANNLAYVLGTLATLATGYAGKKQLDSNKQAAAINRVKMAAKPDDERKVYEALNAGA